MVDSELTALADVLALTPVTRVKLGVLVAVGVAVGLGVGVGVGVAVGVGVPTVFVILMILPIDGTPFPLRMKSQ